MLRLNQTTMFSTNYQQIDNGQDQPGPATVTGIDSKVILIKHGSVLRCVHPGHLQLVPSHKLIDMNHVD